jgi:hypothetical protein
MSRAIVTLCSRDSQRLPIAGGEQVVFRDLACTKICESCGETFARDKRCTWKHWERARFCSRKCYGTANAKRLEAIRPPMRDKFNQQIRITDGCWEWIGLTDKDGYGLFPYEGTLHRAPKIALELDGRPVPDGMYACHTCDNPICVRPDHLYPGTPKQNFDDMMRRGRSPRRAQKLTVEQVSQIKRMDGDHETIAAAFGVSRSNISMIKSGKIWRDVP